MIKDRGNENPDRVSKDFLYKSVSQLRKVLEREDLTGWIDPSLSCTSFQILWAKKMINTSGFSVLREWIEQLKTGWSEEIWCSYYYYTSNILYNTTVLPHKTSLDSACEKCWELRIA